MRSIIFTSAALAAGPVAAQEFAGECYARTYSAAHLAGQPEQTVARLSIAFRPREGMQVAAISATMADTPHTRADGTAGGTYTNVLLCGPQGADWAIADWVAPGDMVCQGECDGGFLKVMAVDGRALVVRTPGVAVSDGTGCGTTLVADVAPDDGSRFVVTTYRLEAAPAALCQ